MKSDRITSVQLPTIHIMAGGLHSLPYARFAAECLYQKCPEKLRKTLRVQIGMFAIPKPLISEAKSFLSRAICVSVTLHPVNIWLRVSDLPQGYTRHRIQKVLGMTRRLLGRLGMPPPLQTKLCPGVPGRLADTLQEYFVRICADESHSQNICLMDADFFVWDDLFFDELLKLPEQDIFASGWIDRYADGATLHGKTYYPVGSECVRIKPSNFNKWNRQVETLDGPMQKKLLARYPEIEFQRSMVDTAYQACWEAQFAGMKIDYPFRGLKACHIGGFGHSNVEYIKDSLKEGTTDGDSLARFWVQRIRLNERVAQELARRFPVKLIASGLENIHKRAQSAWADQEVLKLRNNTSLSNDELLFEEIISGRQQCK